MSAAAAELMSKHMTPNEAKALAERLSSGIWTHDYPITYEAAKSLGLPVRSDIPSEFIDLMALYPQPVRRSPAVEYLPVPRRAEGDRGSRD